MQSLKSLSNGRQVALIVHSPAQLCQRYCGHKSNKCKIKQEMASKRCLTDHQFTSTSPVPSSGRISVLCFLFCWSCNWVASNFSLLCLAVKGKKNSYEKDKSASTACFFETTESVWWREHTEFINRSYVQGDERIVHMKYQCRLQMGEMQIRPNKSRLELATKLILSALRWLTQSSLTEHFSEAYLFTFVPPAREKLFKYWRLSSLHHTSHLCPIGVPFLVDEFLAVVKKTGGTNWVTLSWSYSQRRKNNLLCSIFNFSFVVYGVLFQVKISYLLLKNLERKVIVIRL